MVVFEVLTRRAVDPVTRGLMVDRGHQLVLDPDKFSGHAVLADRLRRLPRVWRETSYEGSRYFRNRLLQESREAPPADELLPHQRALVERLKAQNQLDGANETQSPVTQQD